MATGGDDFGEVIYTGNAGAGGFGSEDPEDPYSAGAAQVTTEAAGAPVAAENEDDIYGFSENGAQPVKTEDDDEDEFQIVLDTDNLEKNTPGHNKVFRSSGNMTMPSTNFSAITPGGKYSLGRNTTVAPAAKGSQQQQRSIFELDIDSMEEKPWRRPGVDLTDYFNYGFNEDSWRQYCEKQSQMRLEQSMQSKIKVYESTRGDKEPSGGKQELPPELQAMVDGGGSSAGGGGGADKRGKRTSSSSSSRGRPPTQEDWPSRDRGFDHRRRQRELDPAVIHITTGGDDDDVGGIPPEGMEEFYIPTSSSSSSGSSYPSSRSFAPDFPSSRDDRRRDEKRVDRRDRRSSASRSRSPSSRSSRSEDKEKDRDRRERDKEKDKEKEKDKDKDKDRERRDRDKRKDGDREREDRDKEKDSKERDREKEDRDDHHEHKRKSSSREDEERAKRRR